MQDGLMDDVRIGHVAAAHLALSAGRIPDQAGPVEVMTVSVRDGSLAASRDVWEGTSIGFGTLVNFLASLEADWRGWSGERTFESVERDLLLSATHDGHVNIRVELGDRHNPGGWLVRITVRLDPGEELSRATNELRAVVGG